VKHYLWHGNVDKALECVGLVLFDLDVQRRRFPSAIKLERSLTEFEIYMQWTPKGAPLLLQMRTKVLNGDLEEVFLGWYLHFRSQSTLPLAC
jgi:hypothetical protein